MSYWGIFLGAFLIGFSGAMMPGPMLGLAIDGSMRRGFWAGPLLVLGHGLLEVLLVAVMLLGLNDFFGNPTLAGIVGLGGGLFLGWMGYGMIRSSVEKTVSLEKQGRTNTKGRNFILAGAVVSITNPYFIVWWASTGMKSVRQSYTLGLTGILFFFSGHLLSDLTWYSAVSFTFSKGKKLMNDRIYRTIICILGIFLLVFAAYFIYSGLTILGKTS